MSLSIIRSAAIVQMRSSSGTQSSSVSPLLPSLTLRRRKRCGGQSVRTRHETVDPKRFQPGASGGSLAGIEAGEARAIERTGLRRDLDRNRTGASQQFARPVLYACQRVSCVRLAIIGANLDMVGGTWVSGPARSVDR